jgi:transposase-like protein
MRKYQPAQVDWAEIEQRIKAGESFNAVSKDYSVSRQAIQKRCSKEGWVEHTPVTTAVRRQLRKRNQLPPDVQPSEVAMQPVATMQPQAVAEPSAAVMARDDKQGAALELLRDGVPRKHAAQGVGVSESTLLRWINDDDGFGAEVRAAESAAVAFRVRRIGKAGEKDWRADSWYLERAHRAEFGSDSQKGGGVAVQINIERGGDTEVIDVTPGS